MRKWPSELGKSENLATLHPYDLTQSSGQEIWGGRLNLIWLFEIESPKEPIIINGPGLTIA